MKAGLTQKQLADAIGVDQASVANWESGRIKPNNYAKVERMAKVLSTRGVAITAERLWHEMGHAVLEGKINRPGRLLREPSPPYRGIPPFRIAELPATMAGGEFVVENPPGSRISANFLCCRTGRPIPPGFSCLVRTRLAPPKWEVLEYRDELMHDLPAYMIIDAQP